MSRYSKTSGDGRYTIAYGFDDDPLGGYFFQLYDMKAISKHNDEGIVIEAGLCPGIPSIEMIQYLDSISEWGIPLTPQIEKHKELVKSNMPI